MRAAVDTILALDPADLLTYGAISVALTTALWDATARRECLERTAAAARDAGSLQLLDTALWTMSLAELSGGTPRRAHEYIEQVRELRRAIGYDAEHVINVALLAWSDAPRPQVEMISEGAASMGFGGVAAAGQAALAVRDLAEGQLRRGLPPAQTTGRRPLPPGHPPRAAPTSSRRRAAASTPTRPCARGASRGAWRPSNGSTWTSGVAQRSRALVEDDAEPHYLGAHLDPGTAPTSRSSSPGLTCCTASGYGAPDDAGTRASTCAGPSSSSSAARRRRSRAAPASSCRPSATAPRPPGTPDTLDLTAQELTVARLAAAGHTNAEIGATMFLSAQHGRLPPAQGLPEARDLLAAPAGRPARHPHLRCPRRSTDYERARGPRRGTSLQARVIPLDPGGTPMPFVTADDGAQIFYKDWGAGGTPVLLSHGWPLNADAWEATALFLAEHGHRAIAHDRRGHGRSSQTWHGNEMDTYADDLACLIDALDLHRPHPGRALHRRRRDRALRRPARHRPRRQARPRLAPCRRSCCAPTTTPKGCRSRCSTRSAPGEAANRSQLYRDLADGPFFGHNRNHDVDQGFRDAFWLQSMACGHRGAYECIAAFSATDFRPDLDEDRRPDAGHPRRRRPDRAVRGRRQALRRADRRRRAQGLRRAAATPCPTPTATGSTPTCSRSSTPDHTKEDTTMNDDHRRHHRPRPRTVDDPPQLGALGHALPGQGPHRADPRLPRLRHRGRGPAREPRHHRQPDRARDRRPPRRGRSRRVETPPIIMGHSFGGTLTQLLLARGLGSAGVVIDSAPTEGVRVNPISQARSLFPALKNPANRHKAVGFTPEEFHYAFTNTLTEEDSQAAWERYADPGARQLGLGVRTVRQLQARPPGHLGRLLRRPGARCCSSAARRTTSCRRR